VRRERTHEPVGRPGTRDERRGVRDGLRRPAGKVVERQHAPPEVACPRPLDPAAGTRVETPAHARVPQLPASIIRGHEAQELAVGESDGGQDVATPRAAHRRPPGAGAERVAPRPLDPLLRPAPPPVRYAGNDERERAVEILAEAHDPLRFARTARDAVAVAPPRLLAQIDPADADDAQWTHRDERDVVRARQDVAAVLYVPLQLLERFPPSVEGREQP